MIYELMTGSLHRVKGLTQNTKKVRNKIELFLVYYLIFLQENFLKTIKFYQGNQDVKSMQTTFSTYQKEA